jgi:cytochrome c oxidase assembly factor CtaG
MQTTPLDLVAQAVLICAGAAYGAGVQRLAAAGRRWPVRRSIAFWSGLLAVWVAVGSRLAAYDDSVVTIHVVQHLLLMMLAPPLMVLGQPMVLASQAAGRRVQARLVRLMNGPLRVMTNPVAVGVAYLGSMFVMMADRPVYAYLVGHDLVRGRRRSPAGPVRT